MKASATQSVRPLSSQPSSREHAHLPHPGGSQYDGWIISYDNLDKVKPGASITVSADVIVPSAPKTYNGQTVLFFNSVETTAGTDGDIVQSVLDYGATGDRWIVDSEHCCIDDNDMHADPSAANPGDLIHAVMAGTGCDSSGVCSAWTITGTDMNTGKSVVLNTTTPGAIDEVNSAVLETYDISSCDLLPANGEITYFNTSELGAGNKALGLKYDLDRETPMTSEFPKNCGLNGVVSGNSYTLIFGTNPTSAGGAPNNGAGGMGGNANGAGGTGGGTNGAGGVGNGAGGVGGSGGIANSAGGSLNAGGSGADPTAGVSGSLALGGAPSASQAGSANPSGVGAAVNTGTGGQADTPVTRDPPPSASCSCRMGAHSSPAGGTSAVVFLFGLAQLLHLRRRKWGANATCRRS